MPSLDIHSRDGGQKARDLLSSFFGILLLKRAGQRPMYLISPWLSDFRLLDNSFGQFGDLFSSNSSLSESPYIHFSDVIREVSAYTPVRIITWPDEKSIAFAKHFDNSTNIEIEFEEAKIDHQKGLLTDSFYFEGSMNFTYRGVYVNSEKITCNASYYKEGKSKINEAYMEFERIWNNLTRLSDLSR